MLVSCLIGTVDMIMEEISNILEAQWAKDCAVVAQDFSYCAVILRDEVAVRRLLDHYQVVKVTKLQYQGGYVVEYVDFL